MQRHSRPVYHRPETIGKCPMRSHYRQRERTCLFGPTSEKAMRIVHVHSVRASRLHHESQETSARVIQQISTQTLVVLLECISHRKPTPLQTQTLEDLIATSKRFRLALELRDAICKFAVRLRVVPVNVWISPSTAPGRRHVSASRSDGCVAMASRTRQQSNRCPKRSQRSGFEASCVGCLQPQGMDFRKYRVGGIGVILLFVQSQRYAIVARRRSSL